MALPGELCGTQGTICSLCGEEVELDILSSPAGFYLGYWCCGPISRETRYMPDWSTAETELGIINDGGTSIYER